MQQLITFIVTLLVCSHITATPPLPTTTASPNTALAVSYFSAESEHTARHLLEQHLAPIDQLDLIIVAFANIVMDPRIGYTLQLGYNADETEKITKLILQQKKANAKVLISIYSDDHFPLTRNADGRLAILADPRFSQNVTDFLAQHHLQGIDLDLENDHQAEDIKDIVTTLAPKLHQAHDLLTVSVLLNPQRYVLSPGKNNEFNQADFIGIQNYFCNNNLNDFANTIESWHYSGIAYNKILGGINCDGPNVGRLHTPPDQVQQWACWARGSINAHCQFDDPTAPHLAGMFSWRLDNDNSTGDLDISPTFASTKLMSQLLHKTIPATGFATPHALQPV